MGTTETPGDLAIKQNFWTIQIRHLDVTIDRIQAKADILAESNYMASATRLREALALVQEVRNGMLVENYDANRKNEVVRP